jgi:hypothetical protein
MEIPLPKPLLEILSDREFDNFTLIQLLRRLQEGHGFTQPITIRMFIRHAGHFILELRDIGLLKLTRAPFSSEGVFCKSPLFYQIKFSEMEITENRYAVPDHPMEQLYQLIQRRLALLFDINSKIGEIEMYEQLINDADVSGLDNSSYLRRISELAQLSGKVTLIENIFYQLIGVK